MEAPTRDDAQLLVQLASLFAEMDGSRANGFVWSDEFVSDYEEFKRRHPWGSDGARYVNTLAGFNETVGTLVKHGLLNESSSTTGSRSA
jgi:hypothetical protein